MKATATPATTRHVMALFFLQPFALGGWFAQIPFVQSELGLSNAQLALALLGLPASFVLVSKVAAALVSKHGAPAIFKAVFPVQTVTVLLPLLAVSQLTLLGALLIFGGAVGFLSVALNVYAGQLEKATGASVMNRCHGFWALGLMVGSLLTSLLSGLLPPLLVLILQSAGSAAIGIWLAGKLPAFGRNQPDAFKSARRKLSQYPRALFLVALFVFSVTVAEGTLNNWAAVFMSDRLPDGSTLVGLSVTIYSGFLALGRFLGDTLKIRLGATNLARVTVTLAALGILVLIATTAPIAAFAGFALIGLGVSVGFPLAVSAAAAIDDAHEADNIAFLAIVAVSGSVIAPPIVGILADAFGMKLAFAALLPGLVVSFVFAKTLASPPSAAAEPQERDRSPSAA